ncbi:MAG: type II toxin-antitoxin system Phd/YefM family antitoxin [Propionibacteriaceae bacterium]|nr:type II toxin-antitoxin system Phd/YefM family antitoxin [Propionibacteriaceae bacterium]
MVWQVQEAKQKFSELLRRVSVDGEQIVSRHGADVAVIIDIGEYHRLRQLDQAPTRDHPGLFPSLDDDEYADVIDTIVADRAHDDGATRRTIPDFES